MLFMASASASWASGLQRADGHRSGVETFEQLRRGLNLVNADRFITRIEGNEIAQRRCRTVVHQLCILLIIAVLAALHRLLQRAHHVRVISVILAPVDIFQQAALFQRLTPAVRVSTGSPDPAGSQQNRRRRYG